MCGVNYFQLFIGWNKKTGQDRSRLFFQTISDPPLVAIVVAIMVVIFTIVMIAVAALARRFDHAVQRVKNVLSTLDERPIRG